MLDWALSYSPSPALKKHIAHYHSGSLVPMGVRSSTLVGTQFDPRQTTPEKRVKSTQDQFPHSKGPRPPTCKLPLILVPIQESPRRQSQITYLLCAHLLCAYAAWGFSKVESTRGEKRAENFSRKA